MCYVGIVPCGADVPLLVVAACSHSSPVLGIGLVQTRHTYMLQADELDAKVHDLRGRVANEQEGHAAMQRAMAADREDITKQGTALVDLGKQVLYQ